jgi:ATP/maltotriose-dependent transcriptional regulator MalT
MTCESTTLTPREWQVLSLVAQGYQLPEVACELVISHHTARAHAHNLRLKLGASTIASAVYRAYVTPTSGYSA